MIERPPNYESLTLTNSSAEFGHHSLSSSNDNFPAYTKNSSYPSFTKVKQETRVTQPAQPNSTILEDLKEEDISFVQSRQGPS